ncbi:hypothetical protein HanIR_Chr05g0241041 [Helianthus annuus]|nr:hypothetical protein HanIR_Chr05g0241041 [Helianthus annuus]
MHPNLEDFSFNSNICTKSLNFRIIFSRDSPPYFLSKLQHFILLILCKFCSKSFLRHPILGRINMRSSIKIQFLTGGLSSSGATPKASSKRHFDGWGVDGGSPVGVRVVGMVVRESGWCTVVVVMVVE